MAAQYYFYYQLTKLTCKALKVSYEVGSIGVTYLHNPEQGKTDWNNYTAPIKAVVNQLQEQIKDLKTRDALKFETKLLVQQKVENKIFSALHDFYAKGLSKAEELVKKLPSENPQLTTPEGIIVEGTHEAAQETLHLQKQQQSNPDKGAQWRNKKSSLRPVYRIDKKTGKRYRIVRPLNDERACIEWAPKKYKEIRSMTHDIDTIAKNTGLAKSKIEKIKKHLFYDEHLLRDGKGVFGADPEVASAWDRLINGDFIENDLKLLEHEFFESRFEKIFKTDYSTAHEASINSGRDWEPPKFE